jgi:hypothetical protein
MTLTDLLLIRNFLSKVVVRGIEEEQLLNLVGKIDALLEQRNTATAA